MINETPASGEGQPSESEVPSPGSPVTPDDDLRRLAVERLADHLEIGASLIERCETLAFAQRGDRLGPLYAAARLMHAQARVAGALAHVAQVERRRRSITERIQTVRPNPQDLISRIEEKDPLATLQKRLDDILQRERQSGLRPPENPDEASQEAAAGES
jgi:NAD-specific glutamate dehydrogenase